MSHAQEEPEPLEVQLGSVGGRIVGSFDVSVSFTEEFRRKLSGGLASHAVIDLSLLDPVGRLVTSRSRVCRFHLDIWQDVLEVRIGDGGRRRRFGFLLIDDGLRACGVFEKLDLGAGELLSYARGYTLRVTVRLNPVSEEMLQSSRDFLSNPRGTAPDRPRSFFGAIARLFSSEKELEASEVFVFEAKDLVRPEVSR